MSKNKPDKTLQELNLLDRFLFARTIEDLDTYQAMLEVLLGEDINLVMPPQTEKEFRTAPWLRSIRVDVYSMDDRNTIYDTEPQSTNTYNLPKRSRYYQSVVDSSLLPPGSRDFNQLNDTVLIIITPFDLFGYGKYRYTFQMKCKEVENLELEDGATRIFFNTRGTNRDEVSQELVELLEYIENTSDEVDERSSNEKIRKIQEQVNRIKSSEIMGVRYMQEWEEKAMLVDEAVERVDRLTRELIAQNRTEDLVRSTLDKEYREQLFQEFGL